MTQADLCHLDVADFSSGSRVQAGKIIEGVLNIEFDGYIVKGSKTPIQLEIREAYYREFWTTPAGMWQYLDLVRRAVETRQRTRGDISLGAFDDSDDHWVHLGYTVFLDEENVAKAYAEGLNINRQVFEAA